MTNIVEQTGESGFENQSVHFFINLAFSPVVSLQKEATVRRISEQALDELSC